MTLRQSPQGTIRLDNDVSFLHDGWLFRLRAAAVIIQEGKVMMASNPGSPYLYSVGGAVMLGESLAEAAVREVAEETGQTLRVNRLLVVHENFFPGRPGEEFANFHELAYYFLMDGFDPARPIPGSVSMEGNLEKMVWVDIRHFPKENAFPQFFRDLPALLRRDAPAFIVTHE